MTDVLFTIGHSTHSLEQFSNLLRPLGIDAVADVRSSPYSRFNPQYNRENLQASLKPFGVAYVFLGGELGARSDDSSCYENGKVSYVRLARTGRFRQGVGRVVEGMRRFRIALLCAEKDPLFCPRALLVARRLAEKGVRINHIHADGTLEVHDQLETRLLRHLGLPEKDLLRTQAQILEDAHRMQNEKISRPTNPA
jgi:uncharacterized protein (DUF488 family)